MLNNNNNLSARIPNPADIGAMPNPLIDNSSVFYFQPVGGNTLGPFLGGSMSSAGTVTTAITPSATTYGRLRRARSTSASAVNSSGAMYTGYTRWFRGDNGGWDAYIQFGLSANTTGHAAFVGLGPNTAGTTFTNTEATAIINCVGLGFDTTDSSTGTWFILYNDGSGTATKTTATNMTRNITNGYDLRITCPPGTLTNITISVVDALTKAVVVAPTELSTNLPTLATALALNVMTHSGSTSTASAIDLSKVYITCNY